MERRSFVATAALALLPASITRATPGGEGLIDTHTHFYDPTRSQGVPWPSPGTPLYRKVLPSDWAKVAKPHGVTKTVVVEASPWLEDNQWILDLAANHPEIIGLIGNLDPADDRFDQNLKRFAANLLFRGIRWRGDKVPATVDQPIFLSRAKALADRDLVLELNGGPDMLRQAARVAKAFPSLRIMIDHVGGAGDAAQLNPNWKENLSALGDHPRVHLKVSALMEITRASDAKYGGGPKEPTYYLPILNHCWTVFGKDRLIYGSDWPVCEKGGTYAEQFRIVQAFWETKGPEASHRYFRENAIAFYQVKG